MAGGMDVRGARGLAWRLLTESVEAFLDGGVSIEARSGRNGDGQTVLMFAAAGGHLETVRLLLHRGAMVNATDIVFHKTALMTQSGHWVATAIGATHSCARSNSAPGPTDIKSGCNPGGRVMYLELREFLTAPEVARLVEIARFMPFVEGRATNPHNLTKVNLQADTTNSGHAEASRIGLAGFARSRAFQDFAMPKKIGPPLLARYEPGMKYGPHADNAFITMEHEGRISQLRSDISCTVFLNDPARYEGGELVLHIGSRPVVIKGVPGEAFIYPSTTLHEVRPVKFGQRLVLITFIESLIPDERDRNSLFELKDVLSLEGLKMDWVSRVRMEVVLQNLTRQWARP